jgi:flagella basal body P-ring formation protein FlgA
VIRFLLIFLLASSARADMTQVTLRGTVRVLSGQAVTLGDVAIIVGDQSLKSVELIKLDDSRLGRSDWIEINASDVQEAIGLSPARVTIRGTTSRIRVMDPSPKPIFVRNQTGKIIEAFDGPILRDHIRARIRAELEVADEDLRLVFSGRDARLIRTPTQGLIVEIQPLGLSSEMPIAANLYDGEKIVLSETLRVRVEVRKKVLVATKLIARRSEIAGKDYEVESRWVAPTLEFASVADMDGAISRSALKPGDLIEKREVEPPIVVKRGDSVSVRCIAGSIVAKITARALGDGRDGDRIKFEPVNGGRRFFATVNGAGRAVLNTPTHEEEK